MASKKDMRREDLIIPYKDPSMKESDNDVASTMASTLPMVAMFTRNKMIGWASFVFAVQTWLAQTPEQAKKASTPGYLSAGMALLGLATTYLPLFMPPPGTNRSTGTQAPPVAPPS
ncbi:hypothetical protein N7G274_003976 [Stereocaulon virgatum]|uniref:Protein Asterix n=1 Tax=Stereocaulon virgatum TaxID=373712 RepID=A0ABR4ACX9_9LECA